MRGTVLKLMIPLALAIIIILLITASTSVYWNPHHAPTELLSGFTYEIADGRSGAATFPHSFKNLEPNTEVMLYTEVEAGKYASLLIKTVYTSLRLYADDVLIYECGNDLYPAWLKDPPTLLGFADLPVTATQLRFAYRSPSQRTTMSVPAIAAGTDGELLTELFSQNSALITISLFFILIGVAFSFISLIFWNQARGFLHLGLFALFIGTWSLAECNATAFLIPYPALLYIIAFGSLFMIPIPLLKYGLFILKPKNPLPLKITALIMEIAVLVAFILHLTGIAALSKTLYIFHMLIPVAFLVFAFSVVWEGVKHKNKIAKQFALPSIVLLIAVMFELADYFLHFTSLISLFFLSGAFAFTIWLGYIGMKHMLESKREMEKKTQKLDFYYKMSHQLLTPLTVVSTNIQVALNEPEEAHDLINKSQDKIMEISEIINAALEDSHESGVSGK